MTYDNNFQAALVDYAYTNFYGRYRRRWFENKQKELKQFLPKPQATRRQLNPTT